MEGSKEEDPHLNFPTLEQFNLYFIEWVLLVPTITFRQVLESSNSLKNAGKISIS